MSKNYYFLVIALPSLQIGAIPEIDFTALEEMLKDNLTHADYAKTRTLRRLYDIENIRSFWLGEPLDPWGIAKESLEEALLSEEGLPPYVYLFLDEYDTKEKRLKYFPKLLATYFREELQHSSSFLRRYLKFERELRLVLTAFRAKKMGRDLAEELQFENPDEPIIGQILAFRDSKVYEPPDEYLDLKGIFEENQDSPLGLYQALCEYRFQKIDEMLEGQAFSIDRVLGYLAQFFIVQKWLELDRKKGLEVVNTIVKEAL